MASRRLTIEKNDMSKVPHEEGVSAAPVLDENLAVWKAEIIGPSDTPYAGGHFQLSMHFPNDYPFQPPQVLWKTKIYHPNISTSGHICVSILKEGEWSPAMTVHGLLTALRTLLIEPNPDDPLINSIAVELLANPAIFNRKAQKWTNTYASEAKENACMFRR